MKKKIAHARAEANEDVPSERKRTPEKLRWCHKNRFHPVVAGFLLLVLVPLRAAQADVDPPLPELLQKLHDLYLDQYPLFAEAFSRAIKLPAETAYGQELKTNINLFDALPRLEAVGFGGDRIPRHSTRPASLRRSYLALPSGDRARPPFN
jgi:hypothetical protein